MICSKMMFFASYELYFLNAFAEYQMMPKFCCDIVKSVCVADKNCDLFANVPEEIHQNDQVFVSL